VSVGQDRVSVELNERFFTDEDYRQQVAELDTYRYIRTAITREVAGIGRLIDIGNGGVFEYETDLVGEIVAVDLFLERLPPSRFPANVRARNGDALALDEPSDSFDAALVAFLYHHLVGARAGEILANVRRSLAEAERVIRPGGTLIVGESCVPPWFYRVERTLFRPLSLLTRTGLMRHPATLQLTYDLLESLIAERFEVIRGYPIRTGRWLSQFGHRWPSALTPARPFLVVALKPGP
jgi:SAM-dependent methyltransferase